MIRNPTPPPVVRKQPVEAESAEQEADEEAVRAARVLALRDAWRSGTLDLSVPDDAAGFQRLLRDVFSRDGQPRRP